MIADEQITGVKNIYLLRVGPCEDRSLFEVQLKKYLYIHCLEGQEIFFDRDIHFNSFFIRDFSYSSYMCADGVRRTSLILLRRTPWSQLALEMKQEMIIAPTSISQHPTREEIKCIMECRYPYNCVTSRSLKDLSTCERFEKFLKNIFGVMPISIEHIKRCVKERELRHAVIKETIIEGEFSIIHEIDKKESKDMQIVRRMLAIFKKTAKNTSDDEVQKRELHTKQKISTLRYLRGEMKYLPSVIARVFPSHQFYGPVNLPRVDRKDHDDIERHFQQICEEEFGCDELLPYAFYLGWCDYRCAFTREETEQLLKYTSTMKHR